MRTVVTIIAVTLLPAAVCAQSWDSFGLGGVTAAEVSAAAPEDPAPQAESAPAESSKAGPVARFAERYFNVKRSSRDEVRRDIETAKAAAREEQRKADEYGITGWDNWNDAIAKRHREAAEGQLRLAAYLEKRLSNPIGFYITRDMTAELALRDGYEARNLLSVQGWLDLLKQSREISPEDREAVIGGADEYALQWGAKGSHEYNTRYNEYMQVLVRYDMFPKKKK